MRGIADLVGRDNPIERAFAMREAAISAAKTNDWRQAEIWFADGRTAAAAAHAVDMQAMAIGLGTDAAVAAVNISRKTANMLPMMPAAPIMMYRVPTDFWFISYTKHAEGCYEAAHVEVDNYVE